MKFDEFLRAGRALTRLSQKEIADRAGVGVVTVANIEREAVKNPDMETVNRLRACLAGLGIVQNGNSIEKQAIGTRVYNQYIDVLSDVMRTITPGEEILVHCGDDRRSSPAAIEKIREMREQGYRWRCTIEEGNTHILGDITEYVWIPKDFMASAQVSLIYGNSYAQHITSDGLDYFIVLRSADHAAVQRAQFEYWWSNGKKVEGR
ncbi:helix-turn-helix domain-containing protein [Parvularcula marina]|uniref:helix-turn-helix domain-containing protein n=1 Tax=Parvularcula marina TaxID=2292771 RepID=UPI0035162847